MATWTNAGGGHLLPFARLEASVGEHNLNTNERRNREQAYELWDHAGRPDGRSDEFWFTARAGFEREEETGEGNVGAHVPPHVDPSRHEH